MPETGTSGSMSGDGKRGDAFAATALVLDSTHASGRAGLQPRRYKAFLIIPVSRASRSLRPQAARDTGSTEGDSRNFGGTEAPPFQTLG